MDKNWKQSCGLRGCGIHSNMSSHCFLPYCPKEDGNIMLASQIMVPDRHWESFNIQTSKRDCFHLGFEKRYYFTKIYLKLKNFTTAWLTKPMLGALLRVRRLSAHKISANLSIWDGRSLDSF